MDFEACKALLDRLGWSYTQDYEYRDGGVFDLPRFSRVKLPLSPSDWVRLCMSEPEPYLQGEESEYLGGCCGQLSAVQDRLTAWFRDGGHVEVYELVDVAEALRDHGDTDFDDLPDLEAHVEKLIADQKSAENNDGYVPALAKISTLFHLVREHHTPQSFGASGRHIGELDEAFSTVSKLAGNYAWERIFRNSGDEAGPLPTQHKARRMVEYAKFLPALKVLSDKMSSLVPEDFEAWALYDVDNEDVATNLRGPCVFASREDAEHVLSLSVESEEDREARSASRKPLRERFTIRPVRVSFEEGIQFLDGTKPAVRGSSESGPRWCPDPLIEDTDLLFEKFLEQAESLQVVRDWKEEGKLLPYSSIRSTLKDFFNAGAHYFRRRLTSSKE